MVVVVLGRGLGKGTVTLDVFGSQETERKEAKEDGWDFFKIIFSPFLQLGINNFLKFLL